MEDRDTRQPIDGFVDVNLAFEASYQDLVAAHASGGATASVFSRVTDPSRADVVLEITHRHEPVLASNAELRATLSVPGSSLTIDLNGRAGVRDFEWRAQAANLLRQTAQWINANRAAIDEVRASRAAKAPER